MSSLFSGFARGFSTGARSLFGDLWPYVYGWLAFIALVSVIVLVAE